MKNSSKNIVNNSPNHLYDMTVNNLENILEEQRQANIRSLFSRILLILTLEEALNDEHISPVEIVNKVNNCAEQNNIKLRKIKVDCFNKTNAKSALKKYIKLDSDQYNEELKELLKIIEEYIVTYGYLDKKSKHKKP